jgi:predicted permease
MKVDVIQVIKDSGRMGGVGVPARRWTTAFLAAEFALTMVLLSLVVSGLRHNLANARTEFPLDSAPLLSMWVTLPGQSYETPESRVAFYDRLVERFAAVPGVSSVTVANAMPRVGGPAMQLEIAGRLPANGGATPTVVMVGAGERYFETLAMPLVRGRPFTRLDGTPGQESAIVNQRLVDMFFGTSDPVGQLIRVARVGTTVSGPWARIVGVSPTLRQRSGGTHPDPVVFLPHRSAPSPGAAIMVRAEGNPTTLAPAIREELRRLDPNLPLYRLMTLQRAIEEAQWNGRMAEATAQNIATIAFLMALVGLYAVTAHTVHWWRPELGLRIALGAQPRGVAWIVLRRALSQLAIGLVVGVACTHAFDGLFMSADDPIRLTDAGTLLSLTGLIATIALAACAIPVRRATQVDPLIALRAERGGSSDLP